MLTLSRVLFPLLVWELPRNGKFRNNQKRKKHITEFPGLLCKKKKEEQVNQLTVETFPGTYEIHPCTI